MSRQPNILERIQDFAESTPNRVAVSSGTQALTYAQINRAANQLAHYLRSQGIGPGMSVGLCVNRSIDLPTAMLGIFKSGATYIPLDPEHPKARLLGLVQQTKVKFVITQESFRSNFETFDGDLILLESSQASINKCQDDNLILPKHDQVAYIMFTSGTSGQPKGVEIEHGTLAERFPFSPYHLLMNTNDTLIGITAVSWNPSIYENLYTLASGAKLALCDTETIRDPVCLQDFIQNQNITFMRGVPSLWSALIDAGWFGKKDLTIVSHGEKLDFKLAEQLRQRGKGLYNTYGSTEATIFSLVQITGEEKRVIPIGSSSGNLLVLDDQLNPVLAGEIGEIYFTGPIIARGYFDDKELTASKFVINQAGQRFYKTGDLARNFDNGPIEFLGRADNQVKIRGQRIELGEVEAAIGKHGKVNSVIVHTSDDGSGAIMLVAYIITNEEIRISDLRIFLGSFLPQSMIPGAFVFLNDFPLNQNGKVDRKALPAPSRILSNPIEAETKTQVVLAKIFAQILSYNQIGIDDNFFQLGGHSLMAALVCSRIKDELEIDLSLRIFFQSPTVRDLSEEIDRKKKLGEHSKRSKIEIQKIRTDMPLSFAQERLWFMNQLVGNDAEYNLPMAIRLKGSLNHEALKSSLSFIINRHEALRTSFKNDDEGKPRQTVHTISGTDLKTIFMENEADIISEILSDSKIPFDLTVAPLIRFKLYQLTLTDHVLYLNLHHIASDGWSKAILKRELVECYQAFRQGRIPDLRSLSIQYLDFSIWHRSYLSKGELDRQIKYWVHELAGLEPLNFPTDRPRPKVLSRKGAQETILISPEVIARLSELGFRHNATLYMVLLSAFNILLSKYSGQKQIAIGSPIAGRIRPETEGLIGFFVNTLVLKSLIDPYETFLEQLQQVRGKALNAYAHQDLPFERLVSEINPERDLSRYPLTQTIFALQNTPFDDVFWKEIEGEDFNFQNETTRFDFELHAWESSEGLRCHLIYNTELFDQWRMKQFLSHFNTVLDFVSLNPQVQICQIPLLSHLEQKKLLFEWNNTTTEFSQGTCIHQLVEKMVQNFPDRLAISSHEGNLTYEELNQRANQMAHFLINQGVLPDNRVAISLPRSANLLIGMLGVLKAGAAYVPLDPDYPKERLDFMYVDSKASLLLTEEMFSEIDSQSKSNPSIKNVSDQLAYIIYTSGSTGKPNGVKIAHKGLVNLVQYFQNNFEVTERDRSIYISSPSFDASSLEVWAHLTIGASLFIPETDTRMVLSKLITWIDKNKLTICFLPTSFMEQIFDLIPPSSIRLLLTGGDRLRRYPPNNFPKVMNLYGPTENTVVSTVALLVSGNEAQPMYPPIGRPIANHHTYVLDQQMNPVPIGVVGELVMGGVGISKGYVERPELTEKKFVKNPFGDGILYRTGDLVRYLPDGQLEFFGRIDHQVKVRGYRIETEEITSSLLGFKGIKDAFTMVREDLPGDKRIVSYIVPDLQTAPELEARHVAGWQQLYDREYTQGHVTDSEFNITGWNSSITGDAIPAEAMREWVDSTVSRIKDYAPKDILEIGCGTGLLLFPLLDIAHSYTATDISPGTIQNIRRHIALSPQASKVDLYASAAHDFSWDEKHKLFDTVVLNSVVQYFPSSNYLLSVIKELVQRVASGGRIFIGDVRNFDLRHAFHLAIELQQASDNDVTVNLNQKIESRILMDKELLLGPQFFYGLISEISRISSVEIRPKRGQCKTEMNMFRYDVTLHLNSPAAKINPTFIKFENLHSLEKILQTAENPIVVEGIVDRRNGNILQALSELKNSSKNERLDQFRKRLSKDVGIDLEELYQLANRYHMFLHPRPDYNSEAIDVLFIRDKGVFSWETIFSPETTIGSTDPLHHGRITALRPAIREHLNQKLPDYMIPSTLVFLDKLPVTTNGKINSAALPAPASERPDLLAAYVPAKTETELKLADIFAKTLGLDLIGINDNFFELGGHSLLAIQLVSSIEVKLGVEIPLTTLFEGPTVAQLSIHIEKSPVAFTNVTQAFIEVKKLPLSPIDVNFYYARLLLKKPDSWYQVMELEVSQLNQARLEDAILYAINKHPVARGKLSSLTALGDKVYWDVSARLSKAPLSIYAVENESELDLIREKIFTTPFAMNEAPTCRFVWIRGLQSERLLLRYNHGAMDASGIQCLLNSVMAHYTNQPDPVKRILPFTTEELCRHYGQAKTPLALSSELAHLRGLLPLSRVSTSIFKPKEIFPATLYSVGGVSHDHGCSAVEIDFSVFETQQLSERAKKLKSTLDRLFIVGILKAGKAWNQKYSKRGRVEAYWAVNVRPPKVFDSMVANLFGWSRIRMPIPHQEKIWEQEILNPASDFLLRGALDWMQAVNNFHHLMLPDFLKRFLFYLASLGAPTMFISNTLTVTINEIDNGPLSAAFGVTNMQNHSRFGSSNRPILVIGRHQEQFRLRMVYPNSQFDRNGALMFLETCKRVTLENY